MTHCIKEVSMIRIFPQPVITCSKLTIETLAQDVKTKTPERHH